MRQHEARRCNDHQNKQGFHDYFQSPDSPEVLHQRWGASRRGVL
jgi:hypothetical protein